MLVDTNVLLRMALILGPGKTAAHDAVDKLDARGVELCVAPQNLVEFWAVATRPEEANGLGCSVVSEATHELRRLKSLFRILEDGPAVLEAWEALVKHHQIAGKEVHDARLVAIMQVHGLHQLLSFDRRFDRFPAVDVTHPADVRTG